MRKQIRAVADWVFYIKQQNICKKIISVMDFKPTVTFNDGIFSFQ